MAQKENSPFAILSAINCNEHTEIKKSKWTDKKGVEHEIELTYLSWAWAWHHIKREFPDASYTIYENTEGRPYFDDGRTAWVKTGVTIQGLEHIEYLPIMDHRNASIPVGNITSMDMNKAIQRSLTKACARHGLGLYIYAGEDLPDALDDERREEVDAEQKKAGKKKTTKTKEQPAAPAPAPAPKKKPLPKRGSDEWNKWVVAIINGWTSKTGKTALQVFAATYDATEDIMQDIIGCLEEDVMNYRIDNNLPANA